VSDHPSFPYPTLQEALFEIRFERQGGDEWSPHKPARLVEAVKESYPTFESVNEQSLKLTIGPDGLAPQFAAPSLRLKFPHNEQPILIQLWQDRFSINALKPYPGWEVLESEFQNIWPRISEVIKPTKIHRIGMRYINRIQRAEEHETPGKYIKENKYVAQALLGSDRDFISRIEVRLDKNNRIFVTVAHDKGKKEEPYGSLVFDIDRIYEGEVPNISDEIISVINKLHGSVWDVFNEAKNQNYDRLLMEGSSNGG